MTRRRPALVVASLALVVVAGVALLALLRGHDGGAPPRPAPAGLEPLAFMPARAQARFDLDTDVPSVAVAATELIPRLPGATLSAAQLRPLVGGRMAVAVSGGRMWLAAVTRARPPRPARGAAAAARGGTVVVAPDPAALRASLASLRPGARAAFDRRFAGLPAASARVAFDARALLLARSPAIASTPWGRSLRAGAAVLVVRGDRIVLPFRVAADPAGLKPSDLPVAAGAGAPRTRGTGPVVAATRSPAQTLAFLRAAGLLRALDVLGRAPGFLRPDLSNLGPDATITTADGRAFTVLLTPPDPGDWSAKLARLDLLSGLIRFAGLADVRIDHGPDGAYTIEQGGRLAARAAVYGRAVVLSTDPSADLRAAARAPATPPPPGAAGALTVRLAPSLLAPLLPALVRPHAGDVTGWARAELGGLEGELGLRIR